MDIFVFFITFIIALFLFFSTGNFPGVCNKQGYFTIDKLEHLY